MRTLDELIDTKEPGWPVVEQWLGKAKNPVEVLAVEPVRARHVLSRLQVTTRSPMGAIALESGGLVIDGWLRVLGGSGPRMRGDLARYNGLGEDALFGPLEGLLIVALDVLGGVFALSAQTRTVCFFSPDSLEWEDLTLGYSDFVCSMMQSNLDQFFRGLRWDGWRDEAAKLTLDQGISVYPFLWTKEAKAKPVTRRAVPMHELVGSGFDLARQLGGGG